MIKLGNNSIGKIYLGSNPIGKAYLGSNLVFNKGESPMPDAGDISNYVQDGLVLHLDGINKGATSGRWTSLVGNAYCVLTTHSTSESNSILMDGAGYLTVTNPVTTGYSSGTIEVCAVNGNTNTTAFYYGTSGRLSFMLSGAGYCFGVTSSNNQWSTDKVAKFTASANSSRLMVNGVVGGTLSSNNFADASATTIGGRAGTGGSRYYVDGRIHSIRIYNRQLTEAEMLQNQKVDDARFGLNLNI